MIYKEGELEKFVSFGILTSFVPISLLMSAYLHRTLVLQKANKKFKESKERKKERKKRKEKKRIFKDKISSQDRFD